MLEAIIDIYSDFPIGSEDKRVGYVELQSVVERLCKERSLYDELRAGSGISHFMDDLAFYNIIEIERPKGDAKKDVKQSRFWLKVELDELNSELSLLLRPQLPSEGG